MSFLQRAVHLHSRRYFVLERKALDRAGRELAATAGGAVRLRVDSDDLMAGGEHGLETLGREIRRAGKHNAHVGCFSVSLIRKNRVVTRS